MKLKIMPTKLQRREIYWTAYCCLDGEECELTERGICWIIFEITDSMYAYNYMNELYPELWECRPIRNPEYWALKGSPGWPARKEILLRAIEMTY